MDDESVDMTVGRTGGGGTIRSPRLDVQLKCSGRDLLKDDGLHFQLKRKNYDDLRTSDYHVPRILVVLLVPESVEQWCINVSEQRMCLYQNAWWMTLKGADDKVGVEKPTVILPRGNLFHPPALSEIMDRIGRKEAL